MSHNAEKKILSLVIEDNPTNLELMTYILSAFGHTTISATDGEEGIEVALQERPSIILCDVQLPKVDGYEVAARLKAHPELSRIPLIAVTALAMVGDRERLIAAGFDGYIGKPITPETFAKQVEEYLPAQDRIGKVLSDSLHDETAPEAFERTPSGKILIINHSFSNIELARTVLEPSGFAVRAIPDPITFFSEPDEAEVDVVLYDVHGNEDRGLAFVTRVAGDTKLRSMPLILISSSAWRHKDRDAAGEPESIHYMVRPVDPGVLLSTIHACLGRDPAAKPAN